MEKNSAETSRQDASQVLRQLAADRESLASGVHVPRALLAAFGALAAWWVSTAVTTTPGEHYEPPSSGWFAVVGVLVIGYLIQRETGLRLRTMGSRAVWAVAGIILVCMVLFSVSLGLVSFGLVWAVTLTSLVAFGATTWLAGIGYRAALEQLRHG